MHTSFCITLENPLGLFYALLGPLILVCVLALLLLGAYISTINSRQETVQSSFASPNNSCVRGESTAMHLDHQVPAFDDSSVHKASSPTHDAQQVPTTISEEAEVVTGGNDPQLVAGNGFGAQPMHHYTNTSTNLHNVGTSYLSVTLHNSVFDERRRPQRWRRARRHSGTDREAEAENQEE
ncbi:hypothetical protein BJ165DRAFT_1522118 [Panaeolus papilionaceus]|nr:hypothetical protein BJ165DRAFT_1522118 [Panaeolus papilionaceus]